MTKPQILTFIDYYLPGHKAGGPLRTLSNMVENLEENFEFLIVTRDRDSGDSKPYENITTDRWIKTVKASSAIIYYLSKDKIRIKEFYHILNRTNFDLIYLNSYFSTWSTILVVIFRRLQLIPNVPVVIAPRGELSPNALNLKRTRKRAFITLAKVFNLYQGFTWQASSIHELKDILSQKLADKDKIFIAPDLLSKLKLKNDRIISKTTSNTVLRLVFVSRISRMKNITFLLETLQLVSSKIKLSIRGPREDKDYWVICEELINKLPPNIEVNLGNDVPHTEMQKLLSDHDLFVLPTLGENFGHVIFESLSIGTPVLISDKTPWKSDDTGAVNVLSLDKSLWREEIENWASCSNEELFVKSQSALNYSRNFIQNDKSVGLNQELFHTVLNYKYW